MSPAGVTWTPVVEYRDIRYEHSGTGIAKVTINRPEVRNAFRPQTVRELSDAFARIRDDASIGCVLLTGEGDVAFCAGGDQRYKSDKGGYLDDEGIARLNVLDLQRQIRSLPIPVIALVNGSEATVKKFYREPGGWIRLQPANATMQPMRFQERDVLIQGVVVGVIRKY